MRENFSSAITDEAKRWIVVNRAWRLKLQTRVELEKAMENRKNIVLYPDGTGNTMMKGRGTNVWKLYEAVDLTAHRWHQGTGQGRQSRRSTRIGSWGHIGSICIA